jgi:hypothetical protein
LRPGRFQRFQLDVRSVTFQSKRRLQTGAPPTQCKYETIASICIWGEHPIAPTFFFCDDCHHHVKLMQTLVKTVELLERPTQAFEVAIAPVESEYSLNIAGVYQDSRTRVSAIKLIAEQASPASKGIQELHVRPCAAYYHSGLNE